MLSTPAVDFQGSGTLQYLRAESAEHKELHYVLSQWPRHSAAANTFSLPAFTVASSVWGIEFNARTNLFVLRDLLRSGGALPSRDDLAAADAALKRMESRRQEDLDHWANNLSHQLSSHRD